VAVKTEAALDGHLGKRAQQVRCIRVPFRMIDYLFYTRRIIHVIARKLLHHDFHPERHRVSSVETFQLPLLFKRLQLRLLFGHHLIVNLLFSLSKRVLEHGAHLGVRPVLVLHIAHDLLKGISFSIRLLLMVLEGLELAQLG